MAIAYIFRSSHHDCLNHNYAVKRYTAPVTGMNLRAMVDYEIQLHVDPCQHNFYALRSQNSSAICVFISEPKGALSNSRMPGNTRSKDVTG